MTGIALGGPVLATQHVTRVFIVIEEQFLPALVAVTTLAFATVTTLVRLLLIVLFVATITGLV